VQVNLEQTGVRQRCLLPLSRAAAVRSPSYGITASWLMHCFNPPEDPRIPESTMPISPGYMYTTINRLIFHENLPRTRGTLPVAETGPDLHILPLSLVKPEAAHHVCFRKEPK